MEISRHSHFIDLNFENMGRNQGETNTRIILNISFGRRKGFKNLAIVGGDVVGVIDLYYFYDHNINTIWFATLASTKGVYQ